MWHLTTSASGLTDGSRAVSTKKEDPLSELQLREGVFFLVSQMTSSISTFTIYSICHSPQKSSFAQKVYKRPLRHACGGNRESLLGPRPARRKRSAANAGCRNPALSSECETERLDEGTAYRCAAALRFSFILCRTTSRQARCTSAVRIQLTG